MRTIPKSTSRESAPTSHFVDNKVKIHCKGKATAFIEHELPLCDYVFAKINKEKAESPFCTF